MIERQNDIDRKRDRDRDRETGLTSSFLRLSEVVRRRGIYLRGGGVRGVIKHCCFGKITKT